MARGAGEPLSVAAAKARLRRVSEAQSPAAWVRRHPREALLAGFALGAAAGASPEGREVLTRLLLRML